MGFLDDIGSNIGEVFSGIGNAVGAVASSLPALLPIIPQAMKYDQQQQLQKLQMKAIKNAYTKMPSIGLGVSAHPINPSVLGGGRMPAGNAPGMMYALSGGGANSGIYGGVMNYGSLGFGAPTGAEIGAGLGGLAGDVMGGPLGGAIGAIGGGLLGGGIGGGMGLFSSGLPANFGRNVMTATNSRGQTVMVRSLGRPLLWSGDLAAARRVRRVAAKIRSFGGHRRF